MNAIKFKDYIGTNTIYFINLRAVFRENTKEDTLMNG